MTDAWDPSIPEHKAIAHGIEIGDGIAQMRTRKDARKALVTVGFDILHEEDLAERPDPIPWYYPLEGDFSKAQTWGDYFTVFRTTKFGMWTTSTGVWVLEKVGLVPEGTWAVGETMKVAAGALVDGGRTKVSNVCYIHILQEFVADAMSLYPSSIALHSYVALRLPQACFIIDFGFLVISGSRLCLLFYSTCFRDEIDALFSLALPAIRSIRTSLVFLRLASLNLSSSSVASYMFRLSFSHWAWSGEGVDQAPEVWICLLGI